MPAGHGIRIEKNLAPLRLLAEMDADLRSGAFSPDQTRSGTWRPQAASSSVQPSSPSVARSVSLSSSSSASLTSAATMSEVVNGEFKEDDQGPGYVFNERSGMVHLECDGTATLCGKPLPRRVPLCSEWPAAARTKCSRCFA